MQPAKKWFVILLAMQVLILMILVVQGPGATPARADGIPDAGAQRDQMLEQMKATNEKLDKLIALLSGGDLRVKVVKSDDAAGNK